MINIGEVGDFTIGKCKPVDIEDKQYLIWRTSNELYATRAECPHQGAPLHCVELSGTMLPSEPKSLEYGMLEHVIRCPWHRWEFDVRNGKALFGTEHRKVQTFRVVVKEKEVYLDL